jgi:aspartyl protease family protein
MRSGAGPCRAGTHRIGLTTAMRFRPFIAAALLAPCALAHAADVTLFATLGNKAVFIVNGTRHTIRVGEQAADFRLLSIAEDSVIVEESGARRRMGLGEGYVAAAPGNPDSLGGRLILSPDEQGHYYAEITINGRRQRGVIDTGATHLSLSRPTADAMHIDYNRGSAGQTQTANGIIRAWLVKVPQIQVGTVTVYDVDTVVRDSTDNGPVLIGTSLLNRFQMTRDQSMMILSKKGY